MSTVPATQAKPANRVTQLNNFLASMKSQMALALPKHLTADRMTRLILTEFSKSADLQKCSFESIAAAVMMSSQLGLEIGVGGQAYLIPYKGTATFVPGWRGLVDLNNRAGRSTVWTGAVFEGDFFDWALGDSPYVKHKPSGETDPAKLLFAYAIGRVNGAEWPIIECWPNDRIKRHFAKNNKVGSRHYANEHWEMYARKVVLLQVLKYLPKSIELQNAITVTDAAEMGKQVTLDGDFVIVNEPQSDEPLTDAPRTVDDLVKKGSGNGSTHSLEIERFKKELPLCKSASDITRLAKSIPADTPDDLRKKLEHMMLEREEQLGLLAN